ncbi:FKBP-type peptidyl-prolyl cis-trans isomerase [Paraflavitalea pollutisoli]|uniref:FKBP-type peptidyl-prolyl cis-trans isomerase n=1 Tax=Paraflavitalea pollutisoli TaxID=3034143 RepID=UPI0023EB57ED|nr:FKBP-type peptidyl-prolyl cis-trans isomerase [Paraflavitalea sp. H1-2-19X]
MKRTKFLLGSLAMALLLAACSGGGYKKTKSGLLYKVISDGKGKPAERGHILKFHVAQRIKSGSKDSLLGETFGKMPSYAKVDSVGSTYNPAEIFPLLRKGDSAVVVLMADTLFAKNPGGLPPFIKKKDQIIISFKVIDVFTSDSTAQADNMAEGSKEQARQMAEQQKAAAEGEKLRGPAVKEIEDYLAKNNIKTEKTLNGTFVQIKELGTGPQADSGKKVMVKYTGKLFPSGKEFESNMDGSRPPLDVVVGTGSVIRGWDEGLAKFKKGGKGTLYIPFFEAYGDRPGPGQKPHESLIFDIEIVDVTDANAPQANMPPPPPPANR